MTTEHAPSDPHISIDNIEVPQVHWILIREAQQRNKGYAYFDADGFDSMGVAIATFWECP